MSGMTENIKSKLFLLSAIVFVTLAIVGGIRSYSPVPSWDMWDGYLGFFTKTISGDTSAWWAQHNEHRIVLARFFFWLDLTFFAGQGWFLIVVNYLLQAMVCILFWVIWKESRSDKHYWIGYFIIAWLFWWIQNDNLIWGFQSQFIFAYLLPLSAFYFLHRATSASTNNYIFFCFALLFGVLSIGSMANGTLTLPLMTSYALVARMGWRRTASLIILSVIALWSYFHDFNAPGGHGSLKEALSETPLNLMTYVLLYLGGPFYYLFGKGGGGQVIAMISGIFLIVSSAAFAWRIVRIAHITSLPLALLFFILYIGGTALGTGGGRVIFGIDQALTSRYMTPALMAWVALILLFLPRLEAVGQSLRRGIWIPFLLVILLMLPLQLKALASKQSLLFEREIAALALELGVADQSQIGSIFPSADWALSIAEEPVARNLSIFGVFPFKDVREMIGQKSSKALRPDYQCLGSIDEIQTIEGDSKFIRVRGWIFDPHSRQVPKSAQLIDENGVVQGLIITGQNRPDVANAIDSIAKNSGFKGYVKASVQGRAVNLIDTQGGCQLFSKIPTVFFNTTKTADSFSVSISVNQVQPQNTWTGTDYYNSSIPGLTVFGSFLHSDSDKGSIILKVNRGDKLLYRSGPNGGRQIVQVIGRSELKSNLPVAPEWILLEFSSNVLPEIFEIEFTDNGDSWGEWSAIAIVNKIKLNQK